MLQMHKMQSLKILIASPAKIMKELVETDNSDNWSELVESGKVYVNKDFETDNYGIFLSAIAPVYDENQTFIAAIGIDVSIEKYQANYAKPEIYLY